MYYVCGIVCEYKGGVTTKNLSPLKLDSFSNGIIAIKYEVEILYDLNNY